MNVFDSSAILAYLQHEQGSDVVLQVLADGVCASANWSEIAQRIRSQGLDWRANRALLEGFNVVVEPVTIDDAEAAAMLWQRGKGLSLADRLCLAMAERLEATVWTADAAWGTSDTILQIR